MYSVFAELSATEVYFLLNQEITIEPKLKQHPKVFFQSTALPAESESE